MSRGAPTLSIVVTNFDGEHYLPGMMEALDRTGYPFLEIIVSDDASRDGSRLWLRHNRPDVRVVTSDVNRGPSPTRNAGIAAARGELVLLLDNDGYPFEDAIEPMIRALVEEPELVGVMPRIILRGDPPLVHCDGSRTHFTGQMWLLNGHVPVDEAPSAAEPVQSLMGTAMMFRREVALAVTGFEPDYFFYYEDHDFGTRMRLLGGPLRSVPEARIDHLGGTKGLSFRSGRSYPMKRAYLTAKNRWLFTIRTFQGRSFFVLLPILLLHEIAQLGYVLKRGWFEAYFQGLRWNLAHLGRTLGKRGFIQKNRRVPDRELMQDGPLPLHPGVMEGETGLASRLLGVLESLLQGAWRRLEPHLDATPRRERVVAPADCTREDPPEPGSVRPGSLA